MYASIRIALKTDNLAYLYKVWCSYHVHVPNCAVWPNDACVKFGANRPIGGALVAV